jgi:hypothetical protein
VNVERFELHREDDQYWIAEFVGRAGTLYITHYLRTVGDRWRYQPANGLPPAAVEALRLELNRRAGAAPAGEAICPDCDHPYSEHRERHGSTPGGCQRDNVCADGHPCDCINWPWPVPSPEPVTKKEP